MSLIVFNVYSEYLTNKAAEGIGDFKTGGEVIRTLKYADELVLLTMEMMVLQGTIKRLTETGRCCEVEINTWRVLKCGARKGWRRIFEPIV